MGSSKYFLAYFFSLTACLLCAFALFNNSIISTTIQFFVYLIITSIVWIIYFFKVVKKQENDFLSKDSKAEKLSKLNDEINFKLEEKSELLGKLQYMFNGLSEHVPGLIYQFELLNDGTSNFKYVSDSVVKIFEVLPENAIENPHNIFGKVHKPDFEGFYKSILQSKDSLATWVYEFRVDLPEKGLRWLRGESEPVKLIDRIVWHGYIHDITEQKALEAELKFSENKFRGVFEFSAIGVAIVSIKGLFIKVNNSLVATLGYSKEELIGMDVLTLAHPDDFEVINFALKNILAGNREALQFEGRWIHKNGSVLFALIAPAIIKDENGGIKHLVMQIKNISDRKLAEQQLNTTVANLKGILDASTDVAIVGTDLNGKINLFNKGAEKLLGYTAKEMIGIKGPTAYHRKAEIEKRKREVFELTGQKLKTTQLFLEMTNRNDNEGRQWTLIRKDGTKFIAQQIVTSVKNDAGEITGYLGIATDITKLKEKEKEMQFLIDVTSEQNKRLINFAHIVSHNLRSHSGNFSLLLGLYDNENLDSEKAEILKLLNKASFQLTETVANLNEVVAITANLNEKKEQIYLNEEINRIQIILSGLIHENNVNIMNDVDRKLKINIVPAYLESILLNLFTNAIKYSSPLRQPTIKITAQSQYNFIVLNIEDNGLGIDLSKHEHKLFGMYKTFHGNKDARGIGLFITKNQIEAMRGKIEVESKENFGTTFKVYFSKLNSNN